MNKYKLKTLLLFAGIFAFLFISCDKDENTNGLLETESEITQEENILSKDEIGLEVAKNLAKNLTNIELRDFIKTKALEKFDGDYNFLIETSKDENINHKKSGSQVRFSSFLSKGDIENTSKKSSATSKLVNFIKINRPLLQVAIPEFDDKSITKWDTKNEIPLVAYLPTNIKNGVIPAFDSEGNYYELSDTTSPNALVIVIKENERVTLISKNPEKRKKILSKTFGNDCEIIAPAFYQNDTNEYHFTEDLMNQSSLCSGGGGGSGGGTGGSGNSGCDRDRKSGKDKLYRMKFKTMQEFKRASEWFDGGLELHATIFFGQASGSLGRPITKVFNGRDHEFKNCGIFNCNPEWFELNDEEIITWDKSLYGDVMLYSWVEHDGGNEITLSLSFSTKIGESTLTFGPSLTIKNDDEVLGDGLVEYCDNTDGEGYTYSTGSPIVFQVRQ